jgi:hypothetical protein
MYDTGEGVEVDKKKAVEWYTKAAEQGNINAQYNLGLMYRDGEGVEQNLDKAVEWLQKAADASHPEAQAALDELYQEPAEDESTENAKPTEGTSENSGDAKPTSTIPTKETTDKK